MGWSDALNGILQRYTGAGGGTGAAPADAHEDFQRVAQAAHQDVASAGVEQAFRSDRTPPFPQMVSQMFGQADPNQRAGLLNRILGTVGPGALAGVSGLSVLPSLLGGSHQVSPQQATQVPPQEVEQLAAHAERSNSGVVGEVSNFVTQHPNAMKALGGLAAAIAIQHIARRS
jgi:hypothetical protein